jgi:hypothetical protein
LSNIIKLFMTLIYESMNKARLFVPGKPLQPSLIYACKARSIPNCGAIYYYVGKWGPYLYNKLYVIKIIDGNYAYVSPLGSPFQASREGVPLR